MFYGRNKVHLYLYLINLNTFKLFDFKFFFIVKKYI